MAKNALGSRPKSDYEKKLVGIVDVITGEKVAKFTLTEDGKKFKDGSTSIKVNLSELPKRPKLSPNVKDPKQYRIRMNQDGDGIEAITPVRGHYPAHLIDLGPRSDKDADPAPMERTFGEGTDKENSHLEFFAVYEITEGAYKGVQLPAYFLHYKFEEDPNEEGFTRFAGNVENKKATRLHQLVAFGETHKLYEEPIRWPDDGNILPELLERALDSDVDVEVTLDKGYIILVQPAEEDVEEPEDESDDDTLDESGDDIEDEVDEMFPPTESVKVVEKTVPAPKKKGVAEVVKKSGAKKLVSKSTDPDDEL